MTWDRKDQQSVVEQGGVLEAETGDKVVGQGQAMDILWAQTMPKEI